MEQVSTSLTQDPRKTLGLWFSASKCSITAGPLFSSSSDELATTVPYCAGSQLYAYAHAAKTLYDQPLGDTVNMVFTGLREWWMAHLSAVAEEEQVLVRGAIDWYPLKWKPIPNARFTWDWYEPEHRLTPYDVISLPLATVLQTISEGGTLKVNLWNTHGLIVDVATEARDRYDPITQRLLK
jgi:hypothetical protein